MRKVKGIKVNHLVGSILLGAGIGLLAFSFIISNNLLSSKFKAFVITSGSMEPAIKTGSVVFTRSMPVYSQGDIITFNPNGSPKDVVTHRIVAKIYPTIDSAPIYFTTGDANKDIDTWKITNDHVIGKVTLEVPYLGYIVDFAKTPKGFVILIVIPATIIIYEEIKALGQEVKRKVLKTKPKKHKKHLLIAFLFPLSVAAVYFVSNSNSFFFDFESSSGNVLSAATQFGSPSPSPTTSPSPSPTPSGIATDVVISEVQITGGTGQLRDNDFIELYNPTNLAKSLNGYRLVVRTGSSPNDTNVFIFNSNHIIPAHGYYLWAHKSSTNSYADTITADVFSSDNLAAQNSIALRNGPVDTGIIVDALSWNSASSALKEGAEFSPDPTANQSMERKAYSGSTQSSMMGGTDSDNGNGFDSNNNATDFILRTVSEPQNSSSTAEIP